LEKSFLALARVVFEMLVKTSNSFDRVTMGADIDGKRRHEFNFLFEKVIMYRVCGTEIR